MTKATIEEAVCWDLQMQSDVREAEVAGNGYGGWSSQLRESSHPEQAKAEEYSGKRHESLKFQHLPSLLEATPVRHPSTAPQLGTEW